VRQIHCETKKATGWGVKRGTKRGEKPLSAASFCKKKSQTTLRKANSAGLNGKGNQNTLTLAEEREGGITE